MRAPYTQFTCECGAVCIMTPHEKTGKLAPITIAARPDGNIEYFYPDGGRDFVYRIVPTEERSANPRDRFLNHWANCSGPTFQRRKGSE